MRTMNILNPSDLMENDCALQVDGERSRGVKENDVFD